MQFILVRVKSYVSLCILSSCRLGKYVPGTFFTHVEAVLVVWPIGFGEITRCGLSARAMRNLHSLSVGSMVVICHFFFLKFDRDSELNSASTRGTWQIYVCW